jgi:hypothetical protein
MKSDRSLGLLLGLVLCVVAVLGNVRRADPHLVNVFPDAASMVVAPLMVFAVGRYRRQRGESSEAVRIFSARVGCVAGAAFAVGLGGFTLYRMPHATIVAFASLTAFFATFVLCCLAGLMAGHRRLAAV